MWWIAAILNAVWALSGVHVLREHSERTRESERDRRETAGYEPFEREREREGGILRVAYSWSDGGTLSWMHMLHQFRGGPIFKAH